MIEEDDQLRASLFGWSGALEGKPLPPEQLPVALDQYRLYVQLTDKISERRQTANSFFVAVNTAVIALLGYVNPEREPLRAQRFYFLVTVAGIVLCFLWFRIIRSYRDLNTARFAVVHQIECLLPLRPYSAEWDLVGRGYVSRLYKPFTHIEIGVPWLFFALYATVFMLLILK
jgi:hypothetical protein